MLNSFDTGIKRIFSTNQKWVYLFLVILVKQIHVSMDFKNVIVMVIDSLNELRMQYACSFEDSLHYRSTQ